MTAWAQGAGTAPIMAGALPAPMWIGLLVGLVLAWLLVAALKRRVG